MRKSIMLALSLTMVALSVSAQEKSHDIKIGETFSLQSKILNEERAYWVYLPPSYNDNTFARQRYPNRCARMLFIIGPQRVVDDADAAALAQDGKLCSQLRHRRRPQEPCRRGDCRSPISCPGYCFDLGCQQAGDRATLQPCERPRGQRRRLPVMRGVKRFEDRQGDFQA